MSSFKLRTMSFTPRPFSADTMNTRDGRGSPAWRSLQDNNDSSTKANYIAIASAKRSTTCPKQEHLRYKMVHLTGS
jgi:hypothetical protein